MKVKIQKWGNSLALRIPKSFAVETNIAEGSSVELTLAKNGILVKSEKADHTLASLLADVAESNLHGEADFGAPKGDEIW